MGIITPKTFYAMLMAAAGASAHGYLANIAVGGTQFRGYNPSDDPFRGPKVSAAWAAGATDQGPVLLQDISNPDIICHKDAVNAQGSIEVGAGSSITLTWKDEWAASHQGPIITYLANCGSSCATVDKKTLKFFKINEAGLSSGRWATDVFRDNGLSSTVKIPAEIKAGNYVLRHEIIALHEAEAGAPGAQFYPQCISLKVTGTGQSEPAGVLATQLYSPKDPGVTYNMYKDDASAQTYTIPGPPLFKNAVSGGNKDIPTPVAVPAPTSQQANPSATATSTRSRNRKQRISTAAPESSSNIVDLECPRWMQNNGLC